MACQKGSHCKYCYTVASMANPDFIHKVKKEKNGIVETVVEKDTK